MHWYGAGTQVIFFIENSPESCLFKMNFFDGQKLVFKICSYVFEANWQKLFFAEKLFFNLSTIFIYLLV